MNEKLLKEISDKLTYSNQLNYQVLMSNIIVNSKIDSNDKEILLLLLQDRDRNYVRINHNKQCFDNIKEYLRVLQPIEVEKSFLKRVGGNSDGGYVMYDDKISSGGGSDNLKAISLGVSDYSPWDLEMADYGYKVIEYDGSIENTPYPNHPNIKFHKKFVGNSKDENFISLEEVLKENGIKNESEIVCGNILQIDIENFEWEVLEEIDIKLLADNFSQVIFEFHGCNPEEQDGFGRRIKQLKRLDEYFVPIHLHLNNHGKIFYSNGLFFSTTLEVSYVNKKMLEKYALCLDNKISEGVDKDLDIPTFSPNPEIPIKFNF